MSVKSVPLAEAKANARALEQATRDHRRDCSSCYTVDGRLMACADLREIRAELRELRATIRHWFDPSPDQGTLI
jgi:hypothetical protein